MPPESKTEVTLKVVSNPINYRLNVAMFYSSAILSHVFGRETVDWKTINRAIVDRWSPYALEYIKRHAWREAEKWL